MQSLDVQDPGLPDLQFVLMVLALSTSDIPTLNVPPAVRRDVFDRCWALLHDGPPPEQPEERKLDLRQGTDLTLEAMIGVIRGVLGEAGITVITWDHPPSEPTVTSTPEAQPLIDRLAMFHPEPPDPGETPPRSST